MSTLEPGCASVQGLGDLVEDVRSNDLDSRVGGEMPIGFDQNQNRFDPSVRALPVVTPKVTRIGCGLVDVDALGDGLALQLENKDGSAEEEDDVGTPCLHGELVLEDRRIAVGLIGARRKFASLALERGNGVVPGSDLLYGSVTNERLKRIADVRRGCLPEPNEV